jgi:RimJ/RimL family protein N-acetyltransferase
MPGPAFLRGERVELRTVEKEDLEFVRDALNDPRVWTGLGTARPHNMASEEEWFGSIAEDDGSEQFLICREGDPVGVIGVELDETWGTGELGYWVAPEHWGNGYCTDAVRTVARYAFDHRRLHKVVARTYEHNEGSVRVLEKAGFEREGVHRREAFVEGEYRDVYRYGLLADEFE